MNDVERLGLTVWGKTFSAQIRGEELAFHVLEDAPRSTEDGHPVILPQEDVELLRDLLTAAAGRK